MLAGGGKNQIFEKIKECFGNNNSLNIWKNYKSINFTDWFGQRRSRLFQTMPKQLRPKRAKRERQKGFLL